VRVGYQDNADINENVTLRGVGEMDNEVTLKRSMGKGVLLWK
jgi:hypothetical protein